MPLKEINSLPVGQVGRSCTTPVSYSFLSRKYFFPIIYVWINGSWCFLNLSRRGRWMFVTCMRIWQPGTVSCCPFTKRCEVNGNLNVGDPV